MSSFLEFELRATEVAGTLKLLSHPKRLLILCKLSSGPKNVGELEKECKISQSQLSQFLGKMKQEGLLECERSGTHITYSIANPEIQKLLMSLASIYCPLG